MLGRLGRQTSRHEEKQIWQSVVVRWVTNLWLEVFHCGVICQYLTSVVMFTYTIGWVTEELSSKALATMIE
jgi:hypothetical protein